MQILSISAIQGQSREHGRASQVSERVRVRGRRARPAGRFRAQGYQFGEANVCLIFIDLEPGDGPRLHRHPYQEIFIVIEGQAKFTVGSDTVESKTGQVLIVRPDVPHKFVNSGDGRLHQIDIHASDRFVTEWLEG